MPVRIGLALPQYGIDTQSGDDVAASLLAAARAADEGRLDSVWLSDHPFALGPDGVASGALEPMTILPWLARRTSRVRLGTLVVSPTMRTPALVAHVARTLGSTTAPRLVLGVGAGWYEPEHRAFGVALPSYRDRVRLAERTLAALRGVGPGGPRLLVGGSGRAMLELAARYADEWNVSWDVPPDRFRFLARSLDDACAAVERDPSAVVRSVGVTVLVGESIKDLNRAVERLRTRAAFLSSVDRASLSERIVAGTPGQCADRLTGYGADEVVLTPLLRDDAEMRAIIVERLAPLLRT